MDFWARSTAIVGGAMVLLRRMGAPRTQAIGTSPSIPEARKQGLMTLKMPTARGWDKGHVPSAAPGLAVNAFADDLQHPRWIEVLPNGDVLVAEALLQAEPPRTLMDHAMQATMRRARALGVSANRITLWRDADGDGVADAADACPGTPSGVAVDARGCPRDSDSDGVADAADACPGTRAGAQVDTRGCEPPPAKTLVLKGVQFLSNSDELTLPSLSVLAEVVESLQDNPDVKVEIGGHTDDRGAARYNLELSQRRAQAVRQFLINRGIDAARLRARGYGETQPIADNATAEGRERNRRVELRRID